MSKYQQLREERIKLQEQGLVPEWYSTAGFQLFKERYEYGTDRSVRGQFERIAATTAKHLKGTKYEAEAEQKFFDMMWKGWLSLSTPVMANTGTTRGMPVSCSGTSVDDSIDSFYRNLHEVCLLTKQGFGTASDMSSIRPRGSKISAGGKANGVLPVIKEHVQAMRNVSQGGVRRGAWAAYLDIEHGDFFEVAEYLLTDPDDLNIGWTIKDSFIARLNAGDEDAVKRFQKAMKIKMITGRGYFFFVDKANRKSPQMYKDLGLKIRNSQLCVAPETLVLTSEGYQQICDLEGETVNVWNGQEFTETVVFKTGENQKLLRVVTNSGFELECTPYHKFYVARRVNGSRSVVEKRAHELQPGDKLIKCDFPIIEGTEELDNAYVNGLYSAEGFLDKNGVQKVYFYHEKQELIDHCGDAFYRVYRQPDYNRSTGFTRKLKPKFFVPSGDYTIKSKLEWFSGFCDGDGTITRNGKTQSLQVGNIEKEFLLEIQMMLQTLGVSSKVTLGKEAGEGLFPTNNGTGEMKLYKTQDAYRLLIGQTGIRTLLSLGWEPKRLKITNHVPNRECSQFVKIVAVIDEGRYDDTYCFTEKKRGMGVFNGILTGQCSEIMLFNDSEHTYSCVLSSMNVALYDEWKDTDAPFWATIFLDCIAQEFIERAKGIPGFEKIVRFTEKSRALGLGQAGLHTLFMKRMLPFESFDAHLLSQEVAARIYSEAKRASADMAVELGEPEWCKGYGLRNTHVIAIAPTKASALLIGGVSEGINPDPAMSFLQQTAAGEIDRLNPVLLDLMKKKGCYNEKNVKQIVARQGSVQHVDWLTPEEKEVFKTAFEINQKAVIRMASARGMYIDQWQSLNLFFAADEDPAWIAEVHQEAFEDENMLALYYLVTQAGVVGSKGDACVACQ